MNWPNRAASIGAFLDITERKRATEILRESERYVRGTLDALPEHVAVLNDKGVIEAVNRPGSVSPKRMAARRQRYQSASIIWRSVAMPPLQAIRAPPKWRDSWTNFLQASEMNLRRNTL